MPRAEPLITPEELQCLLRGPPARANKPHKPTYHFGLHTASLHFGAALWLVKGLFIYVVLMSSEATPMLDSGPYLWMRGSLELVCLLAFWAAVVHPQGRNFAMASLLVASTTLLMDVMTLLAFSG